jgi:hypothetical protein
MTFTDLTEQERNLAYARRAFEAFVSDNERALPDDQLMSYFRYIRQRTEGAYDIVPSAFAASGDEVFVEYHMKSKHHGKPFESEGVLRLTMADGVALEVANYLIVCRRRGVRSSRPVGSVAP